MKKVMLSILLLIGVSVMTASAQSGDTSRRNRSRPAMVKVETADIPAALSATLKGSDYEGWTVSTVTRNEESTRYRVELTKSGETKTQWFDKDGKVLQRKRPSN